MLLYLFYRVFSLNFMKKVRFETHDKGFTCTTMSDFECHSPRPLLERQVPSNPPEIYQYTRILPYSNDPIQRYECSNSSPYPMANKTCLPGVPEPRKCLPSNDLDLSMLDASSHHPRQTFCKPILKATGNGMDDMNAKKDTIVRDFPVLSAVENQIKNPPNVLSRDNGFFIRRDNLNKFCVDFNPLQNQFNRLNLAKENPMPKKTDIMKNLAVPPVNQQIKQHSETDYQALTTFNQDCMCHHCVKTMQNVQCRRQQSPLQQHIICGQQNHCSYITQAVCACCEPVKTAWQSCSANTELHSPRPLNALERKYKTMQMYEQNKVCTEVEKQTNIVKEKREPTVSDLFKVIKLQNEQLQLLQEKVDKFLTGVQNSQTAQNNVEHRALQNEHKISIGVMTSFEMVRTSTIINKEVVKQINENSQIQCNRSQISIKEVVSKTQPVHLNFLDGIVPIEKNMQNNTSSASSDEDQQNEIINDDKTLNELSLHNVQVDNPITPLMSPDQSLYLDVKDYSDSEASSVDQSNVGWTYYNKVMTHVNGMLQDSDMPSSASALYRDTRQQCIQMQIDKSNYSVTKRVKFGDDPLGIHQPHIYAASTDTSLKMNQLAEKYLKGNLQQHPQRPTIKSSSAPDMSFATKNYMERHKLLQGTPLSSKSPSPGELPRFLDITALKQQPKFI